MKKITLFILLLNVLLGFLQILTAQESKDTQNTIKVGSSSSPSAKRQIPNYQSKQLENVLKDSKLKNTTKPDNISGSTKAVSGYGHSNEMTWNNMFIEDIRKPGYSIGWITNCSTPILRKNQNRNYLELNRFNSDIYLGKYINIQSNMKYQLILSFKNLSEVQLMLTEYDENNKKIPGLQKIELPKGEFEDYTIDISISDMTEKLFIRFDKKIYGEFNLKNFRLEEVER